MKIRTRTNIGSLGIATLFLLVLVSPRPAAALPLSETKVLYIGSPETPRAREFEAFLKRNVKQVTAVNREGFHPASAAEFDVVLLDWPQTGANLAANVSPLGEREAWAKPTVLLGSAGLNLAVVWKLKGGAG